MIRRNGLSPLCPSALRDLNIRLEGDLIITGNCDEEIGGITGLGFLIQEESSSRFRPPVGRSLTGIGLAARTDPLLIRTIGKSYHGSAHSGVNAIEKSPRSTWPSRLLAKRPLEETEANPGIDLPNRCRKPGCAT